MTICKVLADKKGLAHVQVLDNGHLCWSQLKLTEKKRYISKEISSIPAADILHVEVRPFTVKESSSLKMQNSRRTHHLIVHFIRHMDNYVLRMGLYTLDGSQADCQALADDLNKNRGGRGDKERKLQVFINPVSGRKKGKTIFEEEVEPLFDACGIKSDIIDMLIYVAVTQRSGQITEELQIVNNKEYDGIVVVGGDGSFNEAAKGLLLRSLKDARLDINSYKTDWLPSSIPLGVISAGSGEWMVKHMHGTTDVVTAAIHIIKGITMRLSVTTTHEPERFLGIACIVHSIGYVGDIIHQTQQNRWMGPARYSIASYSTLLNRRLMKVQMTTYPARDQISSSGRSSKFSREKKSIEKRLSVLSWISHISEIVFPATEKQQKPSSNAKSFWDDTTQTESFNMPVYDVSLSISRTICPHGNLEARTGLDFMSMQVVSECSMANFVKHFVKLKNNEPDMNDFGFVECRNVQAVKLKLAEDSSTDHAWYFNMDGESVELCSNTWYVRLHPCLLLVFGTHDYVHRSPPRGRPSFSWMYLWRRESSVV